jgi:hypothetical protein
MNTQDAIRIVREAAEYGWNPQCLTCEIRHEDRPNLTEAVARLEADAQALADVRTLDEWAGIDGAHWSSGDGGAVVLHFADGRKRAFTGPTPDAARHAAAEWVRTETRARAAIEKADRILDAHAREQQSGSLPHASTIGSDAERGAPLDCGDEHAGDVEPPASQPSKGSAECLECSRTDGTHRDDSPTVLR